MQHIFWCLLIMSFTLIGNARTVISTSLDKEHTSTTTTKPFICNNAPILLGSTNPTTQSIELNWASTNIPQETEWEIEIVRSTDTFSGIPTHTNINQNPVLISNLDAGTHYCYRVRALCGSTVSSWSNAIHCFQTHIINPSNCGINFPIVDNNCGIGNDYPIVVNNAPGFVIGGDVMLREVRLVIDHVWEQDIHIELTAPNGSTAILSADNGGASIAPPYGEFSNQDCTIPTVFKNEQLACFPHAKIDDINAVSFAGDFFPQDNLDVFTGSLANGDWTLTLCDDAPANVGSLEYIELVFEPFNCMKPTSVEVSTLTTSTALVNWVSNMPNATSEVEVIPINDPMGSGQMVSTNVAPLQISNLNAGASYSVVVRERCSNGLFSEPSCPVYFTIPCDNTIPTETENFDTQNSCTASCITDCELTGTWKNADGNTHQWLVNSNETITPNTGPLTDKSGIGNYIYVESSNGICENSEVVLQSNCILVNTNNGGCDFSFQYHMFGNDIQNLQLEILAEQSLIWQPIWMLSGNQGNFWNQVFLDLSTYDNQVVQFRFVAQTGSGGTGDIALDELIFYGSTDAGTASFIHYLDADNDGFGDAGISYISCSSNSPLGYVSNDLDCNDTDPFINPAIAEIYCNGLDENCNGIQDDSILPTPLLVGENAVCMDERATGSILTNPNGTHQWFDAPTGGNLLFEGDNFMTSALTETDTFYVEDNFTVYAGLKITEAVLSFSNSGVELQNFDVAMDYTGWKVVLGADNTNINNPVSIPWNLGAFSENEIQTRSKNDWGTNFNWLSIWKGWILLIDDNNQVSDAMFWNWTAADILNFNINFEGINYTNTDLPWNNAGINVLGFCGQSLSFEGSTDTNSASNFTCGSSTLGTENPNVNLISTCKSERIPYIVTVFEEMSLSTEEFLQSCDESFGSVMLTVEGGAPPYNYQWSNGTQTQNLLLVPFDDYNVTVTDANGCTQTLDFPVSLVGPTQTFGVQLVEFYDVTCHGQNDGFLMAEITGGIPPYQYNWSEGVEYDLMNPVDSLMQLSGGAYDLTITDSQGCVEVSNVVIINEPNPLQFTMTNSTDIDCIGDSTGTLTVSAEGGSGVYDYQWSNGATTSTVNNVLAGNYAVTITDQNGCVISASNIIVEEPSTAVGVQTQSSSDVTCFNQADGTIQIQASGGVAPYLYDWGFTTTNQGNLNNLSGGTYQATITDNNGCVTVSDPITIVEATNELAVNPTVNDVNCTGFNSGDISLNVSGGVAPYMYKWSNAASTANISNLEMGFYFCTIQDANDCFFTTDAIFVNSSMDTEITADVVQMIEPNCHNSSDGIIDINVIGGVPPYTFNWNSGVITEDLLAVDGGLYRCTITDSNFCEGFVDNIVLSEPSPITIDSATIVDDTLGASDGSILLEIVGGQAPYTFIWDDPSQQTDSLATNLSQGTYQVTIEDINGCSTVESFEVDGSTATQAPTQLLDWTVYPNPTSDMIQVNIDLVESSTGGITIFNVMGQQMQQFNFNNQMNIQEKVNVQDYPSGIYFIQLTIGKAQITQRLVVSY